MNKCDTSLQNELDDDDDGDHGDAADGAAAETDEQRRERTQLAFIRGDDGAALDAVDWASELKAFYATCVAPRRRAPRSVAPASSPGSVSFCLPR